MKKITLVLVLFLASQTLWAEEAYRLGFNSLKTKDESIPAISLKVKSTHTIDFIFEYANSYFAKKSSIVPIDKSQNFNVALNYNF